MFGVTGILSSVDYRNTTQSFTDADDIVIFTVNDIVNSDWQTIPTSYDNLIKSRNNNFAYVASANTFTNITGALTTTSDGAHISDNYGAYASPYRTTGANDTNRRNGTSGNHIHTVSFSVASSLANFPYHIKTKLYKRNPYSRKIFTLPIGTIVFGENIFNNSGVSANSYYDNKYLCSASSSTGTFSGDILIRNPTTVGSSGIHAHVGATTRSQTGYFSEGFYSGAQDEANQGSHLHTATVYFIQYKKYVKLRTYVVQEENTFISPGMIFGFFSNNVSQGWYCCNGQIVGDYTTPNLVDRYIMCGNSNISSHNIIPNSTDDKNSISYISTTVSTEAWKHRHGTGGVFQSGSLYGQEPYYHTDASITHTHTVSGTVGPYNYESNHFNLIYYIYLP